MNTIKEFEKEMRKFINGGISTKLHTFKVNNQIIERIKDYTKKIYEQKGGSAGNVFDFAIDGYEFSQSMENAAGYNSLTFLEKMEEREKIEKNTIKRFNKIIAKHYNEKSTILKYLDEIFKNLKNKDEREEPKKENKKDHSKTLKRLSEKYKAKQKKQENKTTEETNTINDTEEFETISYMLGIVEDYRGNKRMELTKLA